MTNISPWAVGADLSFAEGDFFVISKRSLDTYTFEICGTADAIWVRAQWPNGGVALFRTAFSPHGGLKLIKQTPKGNGMILQLSTAIGSMTTDISFTAGTYPTLRYTTALTPGIPLTIPFWPRDVIFPGKEGAIEHTTGKVHVQQAGTRSGLLYVSMTRPRAGSLMYIQNLTALSGYCQQTQTSCRDVVGGEWPELGFALPSTKDKPLQPGVKVIITDAFVAFDPAMPDDEAQLIQQYLDMQAAIYLQMPKPATTYKHWPDILSKGLKNLIDNHGCWSQVNGKTYLNAYVCDYNTPPEIMVQLAVLLPLLDYVEWSGTKLEVMRQIKESLPSFYSEELKTLMRWLPAASHRLEGEEEQKQAMIMDSWYLHHPLLNLSRMALKGDKMAEQLFLGSLDFAINVARHFKYQWPVFYNMKTLEVVKAETQPGNGGEKDVAGLYAHIMLQAWELTGQKKYLAEAEKAAQTLKGMGFDLFYQANNTAFAAGALLRLWKVTNNKLYLDLSYTCLANIFRNVQLWDCNYGYGKNFPSFFALFPLNDAPYTAVYEEQEVFCAFHDYLKQATGMDILPSAKLLLTEYIRFLVHRAPYYYPPMLSPHMLSEEVKMGEVNADIWVALEDLHDGWEKSGTVGQEVYGAGNAFGILPRHYWKVPGFDLLIFADYPISGFSYRKKSGAKFRIEGDSRLSCKLMIIKMENPLPDISVNVKGKKPLQGKNTKDGHIEFTVFGGESVFIGFIS